MNPQPATFPIRPGPRDGGPPASRPADPATDNDVPTSAGAGLASRCRRYAYSIHEFTRHRGYDDAEAGELTERFFSQLDAPASLARIDPACRHLRTSVLGAVSHFLRETPGRGSAACMARGDGAIPPAAAGAEVRPSRQPHDPDLTPEEVFDHHWALSTIEHAIACLQAECADAHRGPLIEALGPFVWGGGAPPSQAEVAAGLGMTEHAFTTAVHRLRHRLREHLHAQVATTVADPAEIPGELRFLLTAVRRRPVAV